MPDPLRRFKPAGEFGKPSNKAYERRRKRLVECTRLARRHINGLFSYGTAKEEFFRRLLRGKEKPSKIMEGVVRTASLGEEPRTKLMANSMKLDGDWETVRANEEMTLRNPTKYFKKLFNMEPADNGILVRVTPCHIHLGFSKKNWDLLKKIGFIRGETTLGQYNETYNPRIRLWDLSRVTSFSLAEFGEEFKIRNHIFEEETRHHLQTAFMKRRKTSGSMDSIDDAIRRELAPKIRAGENVLDNVRSRLVDQYNSMSAFIDREIRETSASIKKFEKSTNPNIPIEEIKGILQGNIEELENEKKRMSKNFVRIDKTLVSKPFQEMMRTAIETVPREVLASFVESVNFTRFQTLLPELIKKYKK